MFERLPEILVLCVVGLLVFGPKRVIEMGGSLGKAWREFRESTKELSWTALLSGDAQPESQRYSVTPGAAESATQPAQIEAAALKAAPSSTQGTVEGSIEPQAQPEAVHE